MDQGQTQDGKAQLEATFDRLEQLTRAKDATLNRYERGEISAGVVQAFGAVTGQLWTVAKQLGITERELTTAGSP